MSRGLVDVYKRQSSTSDLSNLYFHNNRSKKHPATNIFRAVRMFINDEIEELISALKSSISLLKKGGRLVVISFHSIEDRIVKNFLNECQGKSKLFISKFLPPSNVSKNSFEIITKKPILPCDDEIKINRKARSAKLRVAKRTKFSPVFKHEAAA